MQQATTTKAIPDAKWRKEVPARYRQTRPNPAIEGWRGPRDVYPRPLCLLAGPAFRAGIDGAGASPNFIGEPNSILPWRESWVGPESGGEESGGRASRSSSWPMHDGRDARPPSWSMSSETSAGRAQTRSRPTPAAPGYVRTGPPATRPAELWRARRHSARSAAAA